MTTRLVLLDRFDLPPERRPGGVELLFAALARAGRERGLDVHVAAHPADAVSLSRGRSAVVFTQQEGRLSAGYRAWAEECLAAGATVVEKNIFALASAHRPRHPRYVQALMSVDGAHRFAWRSALARLPAPSHYLLLPNPLVLPVTPNAEPDAGDRVGAQAGDRTVLHLLRIGRPDPVKWSDWEQRLAAAMARARPGVRVRLTLVGSPSSCLLRDLPPNVDVVVEPPLAVEDMWPMYARADAYVHHSRIGETYGNTLVEGQAAGCFCVGAFRAEWDCAPIEFLDPSSSWIGSPRRALARAGELVDAIQRHRRVPQDVSALAPSRYLDRVLQALSGPTVVRRVPSAREAGRYLVATGRLLEGPVGAVSGPVLVGARSVAGRLRG